MSNLSDDNVTIHNCIKQSTKLLLQGNSSKQQEYHALEKVSEELRDMEKTLSLLLSNRKEEDKPGYWTRVAKRVNKVFFIFYVILVGLFLTVIFLKWDNA